MAVKKKQAKVQVFPSFLRTGHATVCYGEHIIGVLEQREGVIVRRIKVGRNEQGVGVYEAPAGDLARVFASSCDAATAVLAEWMARSSNGGQLELIAA